MVFKSFSAILVVLVTLAASTPLIPSSSIGLRDAELCDLFYTFSLKNGRCNGDEKIPVPCEGWCHSYIQCSHGVPASTGTKCPWYSPAFDHLKKKCVLFVRTCDWWESLTTTTQKYTTSRRPTTPRPATPTTTLGSSTPRTLPTTGPTTAGSTTPWKAPTTAGSTTPWKAPTTAGSTTPWKAPTTAGSTTPWKAPTTAGSTTSWPTTVETTTPWTAPSTLRSTTAPPSPSSTTVGSTSLRPGTQTPSTLRTQRTEVTTPTQVPATSSQPPTPTLAPTSRGWPSTSLAPTPPEQTTLRGSTASEITDFTDKGNDAVNVISIGSVYVQNLKINGSLIVFAG